ncbi:DUF6531 domain-containing protein [Bergeriella denitrificans]|uniref:DUF6531 domain-containing protein n=1 Tax=Bergeriella denitrificans TaxID=494 RepID=UPI0011C033CC|nr:DUF6531 domain-containing protein [Bergeriella denitrificans]
MTTICSFPQNTALSRFISFADRTTRGDPIDVLTGQVVEQRVDFTLGQILPLSFIRTWVRSKDELHLGGLCGRYWVDSFSEYAEISDNGQHIKIASCEGYYLRFALPVGELQSVNYVIKAVFFRRLLSIITPIFPKHPQTAAMPSENQV